MKRMYNQWMRFILTMRNVNAYDGCLVEMRDKGFILTMRNVNPHHSFGKVNKILSFILTMRNVNGTHYTIT